MPALELPLNAPFKVTGFLKGVFYTIPVIPEKDFYIINKETLLRTRLMMSVVFANTSGEREQRSVFSNTLLSSMTIFQCHRDH